MAEVEEILTYLLQREQLQTSFKPSDSTGFTSQQRESIISDILEVLLSFI